MRCRIGSFLAISALFLGMAYTPAALAVPPSTPLVLPNTCLVTGKYCFINGKLGFDLAVQGLYEPAMNLNGCMHAANQDLEPLKTTIMIVLVTQTLVTDFWGRLGLTLPPSCTDVEFRLIEDEDACGFAALDGPCLMNF